MSAVFTHDNSGCACSRKNCEGCKIYEAHKKSMTNADRIRAMTDAELAYFITDQRFAVVGKVADELSIDITPQYTRGRDNTLAWLKQEVDE